ncbi:MAG: DUF2523 domain-containing protein [Proteobacteria bacterium]|nr:DUF2523 domain-containing protein [Pseudomonadota bacterium]
MKAFADWLLSIIKALFTAVWDFFIDAVINIVEMILSALAAIISAIPVPSFLQGGMSSILAYIPADVWVFAGYLRLGECLAILGSAVAFRLLRKAVTLGQW